MKNFLTNDLNVQSIALKAVNCRNTICQMRKNGDFASTGSKPLNFFEGTFCFLNFEFNKQNTEASRLL